MIEQKEPPDKPGDHEGVENFLGEFEAILGHQIREKILGGDTWKISKFDIELAKTLKELGRTRE